MLEWFTAQPQRNPDLHKRVNQKQEVSEQPTVIRPDSDKEMTENKESLESQVEQEPEPTLVQIERPDGNFGEPFNPDQFIPEAEIANWIPVSAKPKEEQEIFGHLSERKSGKEIVYIPKFINISAAVGGELKMVKSLVSG